MRLADFSIATAGEVDTFTPDKHKKKRRHKRFDSRSKRVGTPSAPSSPVPSHKFIEGWNVSNDRPHEKAKSPPSSRPSTPFAVAIDSAATSERNSSERMSEGTFVVRTGERLSEPHYAPADRPARNRRRSWIARLLRRPLTEENDADTEQESKQEFSAHRNHSATSTASASKKDSSDVSMLDRLKAKVARTPVSKYKQGRASFGVDVKHHSNSLVGTVEYMVRIVDTKSRTSIPR